MRRAFPELKQLSKFEGRRQLIRLATHAMFAAAGISSTSSAVALAQGEMRRIGMLWPGLEQQPRNMRMRAAFQDRLRELGHVEGSTIQIHARYAGGALDRLPALARELVAMCDVIVAVTAASSVAVRGATSTIPIVMVHVGNPIGAGLVESLARPGGNVTGTTSMLPELAGKQVEMLHEVLPSARRVALLGNPTNSGTAPLVESAGATARLLGLELVVLDVTESKEFETAFRRIEQSQSDALLVAVEGLIFTYRQSVIDFAARHRLPTMYNLGDLVRDGGLMSYTTRIDVHYPRAADYVDKILKGASPSDLPVEQPTGFEMLINLKTAAALGLTIPPSILLRADEVIE